MSINQHKRWDGDGSFDSMLLMEVQPKHAAMHTCVLSDARHSSSGPNDDKTKTNNKAV